MNKKLENTDDYSLLIPGEKEMIFRLNEAKEDLKYKLKNKNLTSQTEVLPYDRAKQVNTYRLAAQKATGEMVSEEQIELAEAQAVLDGSDSGEYSLEEIWEATKVVRKAREKADTDEGIKKILEVAGKDSSSTAKPKAFEAQVAAMVLNNKKELSGTDAEIDAMISEAEKVLIESENEGGVYQHILDDEGLTVEYDGGRKKVNKMKEENSVKKMVQEIEHQKEVAAKQIEATEGKKITTQAELKKAESELAKERIHAFADGVRTVKHVVTAPGEIAIAAVTWGATESATAAIATGKFAGNIANRVTNAPVNAVENIAIAVTDKVHSSENNKADDKKTMTSDLISEKVQSDNSKKGLIDSKVILQEDSNQPNTKSAEEENLRITKKIEDMKAKRKNAEMLSGRLEQTRTQREEPKSSNNNS